MVILRKSNTRHFSYKPYKQYSCNGSRTTSSYYSKFFYLLPGITSLHPGSTFVTSYARRSSSNKANGPSSIYYDVHTIKQIQS